MDLYNIFCSIKNRQCLYTCFFSLIAFQYTLVTCGVTDVWQEKQIALLLTYSMLHRLKLSKISDFYLGLFMRNT